MSMLDHRYYQIKIAKELGIILAIFTVGTLAVEIIQGHVSASAQRSASLRESRFRSDIEREKFDHYRSELRATSDVSAAALAALLPTEDVRPATEALQALASKNGVRFILTANAPAPIVNATTPLKLFSIDMSIQLSGSRPNIRSFIADAEHLPYFFAFTRYSEQTDQSSLETTAQVDARLWTKPTQSLTQSL